MGFIPDRLRSSCLVMGEYRVELIFIHQGFLLVRDICSYRNRRYYVAIRLFSSGLVRGCTEVRKGLVKVFRINFGGS